MKEPADGLVPDEERDHRQDDGAAESGEVAELPGAEGKARVLRVVAGIAVSQRR